ncbi:hypothetical protein L1049_006404 [Liquidambar formosana]|uniref:Uncharacterized protein n=1 Tax=Liquidambar formosana TaxID=63359 RepID=A0AAP0RFH5_LIQFO
MDSHFSIFFIFILASNYVSGDLVLEDGYTVTTVLDGDKFKINPHSLLRRPGSSDLILLDSVGKSVIKRFSGNGTGGLSDGDSASAMFNKPRSFAADSKGNVYVFDKLIRQINLKLEDCTRGSQSVLRAASIWILGLGVSCLLGLIIGYEIKQSQIITNQLKDLMSFDEGLELSCMTNKMLKQGDENQERSDVLSDGHGRIDNMIQANIVGFAEEANKTTPPKGVCKFLNMVFTLK